MQSDMILTLSVTGVTHETFMAMLEIINATYVTTHMNRADRAS